MSAPFMMTCWECHTCDVQGADPDQPDVRCWFCGDPVIVTARTLRVGEKTGMAKLAMAALTVSLDGGPPLRVDKWEFRAPPFVYARSYGAMRPDPDWSEEDGHGHLHRWDERALFTLTASAEHQPCNGFCGLSDCEGYDTTVWHCAACGDRVSPGYVPDSVARTTGIPIQTGPPEATLWVVDFPQGSYDNRTQHDVIIRGAGLEWSGRGIFTSWERRREQSASGPRLRGELRVELTE